jgi:hypothetical protein
MYVVALEPFIDSIQFVGSGQRLMSGGGKKLRHTDKNITKKFVLKKLLKIKFYFIRGENEAKERILIRIVKIY